MLDWIQSLWGPPGGEPVQVSSWDGDQECVSCPHTVRVDGPRKRGLPPLPPMPVSEDAALVTRAWILGLGFQVVAEHIGALGQRLALACHFLAHPW